MSTNIFDASGQKLIIDGRLTTISQADVDIKTDAGEDKTNREGITNRVDVRCDEDGHEIVVLGQDMVNLERN